VVSKVTAAVELHLTGGTVVPARLIDTGDPRASFFVVVWSSSAGWKAAVARDAGGRDLETHPGPDPRHRRLGP
jgi:hypothetical protein